MQIPLENIPFTPPLIQDYLRQTNELQPLYSLPFSLDHCVKQSRIKKENYSHRSLFSTIIREQMQRLELSPKQKQNLDFLTNENTFTITTGHQLNLFTGPVYFAYKIIQTLKTVEALNQKQSEFQYVPVFWMASEDHDFEEINHCYINSQKVVWETSQKGAVGRFQLHDFSDTKYSFLEKIGGKPFEPEIQNILNLSYKENATLSQATQAIVHQLFGEQGILILDADEKPLKKAMIPYFQKELEEEKLWNTTQKTRHFLEQKGYSIQVNPRKINLFYLTPTERNRIEKRADRYSIVGSQQSFSSTEMMDELQHFPERFSPNAVMRPLYQEVIMPNVAYIGGNAEIAYWLELKSFFESVKVPFPILVPRNSILRLTASQTLKMKKLGLTPQDLLLPISDIEKKVVHHFSMIDLQLEDKTKEIQALYNDLIEKSEQTDKTLRNLLEAQKAKQLKAFQAVEKRLVKAEKRVLAEKIQQLHSLHQCVFPGGVFQERRLNLFQWYQYEGKKCIKELYDTINIQKAELIVKDI